MDTSISREGVCALPCTALTLALLSSFLVTTAQGACLWKKALTRAVQNEALAVAGAEDVSYGMLTRIPGKEKSPA